MSSGVNREQPAPFIGAGILLLGRSARIRTPDPRFWRPMLYQLSYAPKNSFIRFAKLLEESFGIPIIGNEYPIPDSSLGGVQCSVNGD